MIGAIDIGGTKLAVGIVNDDGIVLARLETPTGVASTYSSGLENITAMLSQTAKSTGTKITGIGIGSTGPVNPFSGEFGEIDFLPGWRKNNPVRDLSESFGVQVAMENDADAGALGEAGWGAGKGKSRLIYITVGTGIGGGLVFDGELYRGVGGAHPEIGHQVVDPSGPQCSCGFRGCWESLATGPAMAAWFHSQNIGNTREQLTAEHICNLASHGDLLARRAITREAHYLGLGLANLITIFTPDVIVLGGSVMKSAVLFLDGIRRTICSGCKFVPFEQTEIALASLGDDANLIGAARVWYNRFGQQTKHRAQS